MVVDSGRHYLAIHALHCATMYIHAVHTLSHGSWKVEQYIEWVIVGKYFITITTIPENIHWCLMMFSLINVEFKNMQFACNLGKKLQSDVLFIKWSFVFLSTAAHREKNVISNCSVFLISSLQQQWLILGFFRPITAY